MAADSGSSAPSSPVSKHDSETAPSRMDSPYKRATSSLPDMSFFTPSSVGFKPRPYSPYTLKSVYRGVEQGVGPVDVPPQTILMPPEPSPDPDDPKVVFIRPPFTVFPGSEKHPDGLTYNLINDNPDWFLDPEDFRREGEGIFNSPNVMIYPRILEPPRGWCPTKSKKDVKAKGAPGWAEEETPKLRCTFCRRTYAGVNAKSMWRRHVLEKHKIPMANRRETAADTGRGRRGMTMDIRKSSTTTPTTSPVVQSPPPESGTSGSSAPYTPPRGVPAGDSLTPLLEELQRHTRKVEEMMKKPDDITAHSNLPFKWQRKRKKDSMDVDGSQDGRDTKKDREMSQKAESVQETSGLK